MGSTRQYFDEVSKEYKGCKLVVKLQDMGHRCGYVRVPDELVDIFREKGYNEYGVGVLADSFDVHGGVTFDRFVRPDESYLPQEGYWIGFDCAHCDDSQDVDAVLKHFGPKQADFVRDHKWQHGHVWTTEEVERECELLADQILAVTPDYVI